MCGESWLAIKDSLTHRPNSQGWASWCLLGLFFHAIFNFLCVMYIYMCAFICVALFVWVGITFLPLYSLASVLCTCISMSQPSLQFACMYVYVYGVARTYVRTCTGNS